MPDIEVPDPEELGGMVTKPFKFVTGMDAVPRPRDAMFRSALTFDIAGYDARFPNQNQYVLSETSPCQPTPP